MKEVIALLIGFAAGAAVVMPVGSKVVSEIKKAKTDLENAILRATGGAQASGASLGADKHPIAGSKPTPVGLTSSRTNP